MVYTMVQSNSLSVSFLTEQTQLQIRPFPSEALNRVRTLNLSSRACRLLGLVLYGGSDILFPWMGLLNDQRAL
jgi:hypothetical protein